MARSASLGGISHVFPEQGGGESVDQPIQPGFSRPVASNLPGPGEFGRACPAERAAHEEHPADRSRPVPVLAAVEPVHIRFVRCHVRDDVDIDSAVNEVEYQGRATML